jgi:hypothetical protein
MTEMRFKMDHQKRGYLLIIDNHKFDNPHFSDLIGSNHDVKNLVDTFVYKLDFELMLKKNQTKAQMIDLMKRFSQEVDHTNVDCFMAVFLSHGFTNEKNEQFVCAIDEGVLLTDLTEQFKTCSTLDDKPKIFFCDFCRGGNIEPDYAKGIASLSTTTTTTNGSERMSKKKKNFFSENEFLIGLGSCRGSFACKLLLQYRSDL